MFSFIMFGDIVGRPGRQAVKNILPKLKKKYSPDLVIANGENLAHGSGITKDTLYGILGAGVDFVTSGNHIWKQKEVFEFIDQKDIPLIRPANYPPNVPGKGYKILKIKTKRVLIANILGRVFMQENIDCPFRKMNEILEKEKNNFDIAILDMHTEATSESKALGYYLDGRVLAVLGTHTHIPTQDFEILPKGTAYVTDIGMVGAKDSILGDEKDVIIKSFLTQLPVKFEVAEEGLVEVNAVYVETEGLKAKKIKKLREFIEV